MRYIRYIVKHMIHLYHTIYFNMLGIGFATCETLQQFPIAPYSILSLPAELLPVAQGSFDVRHQSSMRWSM